MKFNKVLILFFLIILIITVLLVKISLSEHSKGDYVQSDSNSAAEYCKLLDDKHKNGYIKNYAGSYLDEAGTLNINIVGNNEEIKKIIKIRNVKYHNVKYTLSQLEKVQNTLNKNINEYSIKSIELDIINNKVIIYPKIYDSPTIEKIKKGIGSPAVEAVEFKKMEYEEKPL